MARLLKLFTPVIIGLALAMVRRQTLRRRQAETAGHGRLQSGERLPRVVVVGAGFGGLRAVRTLANAPVDVILIDRQNYHSFSPLFYQVATAALEPEEIAYPVRAIFRHQKNFSFQLASVIGIDFEKRQLETTHEPVPYDYLILAPGSATNFFGLQSVEERSFGLKDLDDAIALRSHLLECFELAAAEEDEKRRNTLLTFVVVGGGPTGVELTGAMAELIHEVLAKDFPALDVKNARVLLLEAAGTLIAGFESDLQQKTLEDLQEKGVIVELNAAVQEIGPGVVTLRDGRHIEAETVIWTAGVRASDLVGELGAPTGRSGRVSVLPTLQVPGHEEIYVIGDAAAIEQDGQVLPMIAPVAMQQGETAANNIQRQLRGEAPVPFHYRDKGMMVTIGRSRAVARIWKLKFTGFIAWVVWLTVHIWLLIGFRNRLLVLTNWAWDYFFRERAVRLIRETENVKSRT